VAWQSVRLESANLLKLRNRIFFAFLAHPVGKQLAICAGLCKFAAGLHCLRSAMHCISSLKIYFHIENEVARLRHLKLLTVDEICMASERKYENSSQGQRSR